jgi:hypothetical protein
LNWQHKHLLDNMKKPEPPLRGSGFFSPVAGHLTISNQGQVLQITMLEINPGSGLANHHAAKNWIVRGPHPVQHPHHPARNGGSTPEPGSKMRTMP